MICSCRSGASSGPGAESVVECIFYDIFLPAQPAGDRQVHPAARLRAGLGLLPKRRAGPGVVWSGRHRRDLWSR